MRTDPLKALIIGGLGKTSRSRLAVKDGRLRLQVLISELEHAGHESAARCLADDLDALVVHLRYPLRHRESGQRTCSNGRSGRSDGGRK